MTKQEEVMMKLTKGRKFDFEIKPSIIKYLDNISLDNVSCNNNAEEMELAFIRALVEESCSVANLEVLLEQIEGHDDFSSKILKEINRMLIL